MEKKKYIQAFGKNCQILKKYGDLFLLKPLNGDGNFQCHKIDTNKAKRYVPVTDVKINGCTATLLGNNFYAEGVVSDFVVKIWKKFLLKTSEARLHDGFCTLLDMNIEITTDSTQIKVIETRTKKIVIEYSINITPIETKLILSILEGD